METRGAAAEPDSERRGGQRLERVSLSELGATVHLGGAPQDLLDELPDLYSSVFATPHWWTALDRKRPEGVCVLDQPRHVIAFTVEGDTVEILNKVFVIRASDARRACLAIFRAVPQARRIHIEVPFRPRELRLPLRVRNVAEHMVIDLPATVAEYDASLGKRTRGNLRNFQNRLRRDHPDVDTRITVPGAATPELFDQFLTWKNDWFHARHGYATFWENKPVFVDQYKELLSDGGEVHLTTISGEPAAIRFMYPLGDSTVSLQGSFDPAYEKYRLGLVSSYWSICDAVERGMRRVNLLWGTPDYKTHLGANPRQSAQLSVFRSQTARLYSLGEARGIMKTRLRRQKERTYWKARAAAGRTLRRAGLLPRKEAAKP
jgi:CelD/BcsL family acetyltransferase involved in cellulose biosynthesis